MVKSATAYRGGPVWKGHGPGVDDRRGGFKTRPVTQPPVGENGPALNPEGDAGLLGGVSEKQGRVTNPPLRAPAVILSGAKNLVAGE